MARELTPVAVSLTRPWPYAIAVLGMRLINRKRRDGVLPVMCHHRGRLYIHAAKSWDGSVADWIRHRDLCSDDQYRVLSDPSLHRPGGITLRATAVGHIDRWGGAFDIDTAWPGLRVGTGCVRNLDLRWWNKDRPALVLGPEIESLVFSPCTGKLGLWPVPDFVVARAERGDTRPNPRIGAP